MLLLVANTVFAICLGVTLPRHWGLWGFIGAVVVLFCVQAGINVASGFEGTSLEESLLLFNGSYASYVGFNLQITYRAFALPILGLALPLIYRLCRDARPVM